MLSTVLDPGDRILNKPVSGWGWKGEVPQENRQLYHTTKSAAVGLKNREYYGNTCKRCSIQALAPGKASYKE